MRSRFADYLIPTTAIYSLRPTHSFSAVDVNDSWHYQEFTNHIFSNRIGQELL